ncbi:MAG: carboxylesterase family protein, partial [Acidimicrobiales bacterium]
PVDAVVEAQTRTADRVLDRVGKMPFHPVIDGDLLPAAPLAAARAGDLAPVPLVIGTNSDEMALFRDQVPSLPDTLIDLVLTPKLRAATGHEPSPDVVAAGRAAAGDDLATAIADVDLHLPAALLADAHCRAGYDVWRYRFDWQGAEMGAAHAFDLPFTFGTLDVSTWRHTVGAQSNTAADCLSRRVRSAWAAFAAGGRPACDPVGTWPRHHPDDWAAAVLGTEITLVDDFDRSRLEAWLSATDHS